MLGLESRGGGNTLALPSATRDRLSAWSPFRSKAPRAQALTISLGRMIGGAASAGVPDAVIPPPTNFAQLERRYGSSAPVYACVRRKARDIASAPFRVTLRTADDTLTPVKRVDPLATLLARPNPWTTGAQLAYFCSMFLDLTGNFFLLILRDGKGVPRELYPVNPMAVTIYGSPDAMVSGYELFHYGRAMQLKAHGRNEPGDLLHFKLPSPVPAYGDSAFPSPWGMGPLEAAWDLVVTAGDVVRWNRNLVKNDGRPAAMLSTTQAVSNTVADEAMARWKATYGGPDHAGAVAVLGNDLKYTQLAFNPKDMDYVQSQEHLWDEILAIFDVNGTVLGLTRGDVGRRTEQVHDYWHGTVIATSQNDICPVLSGILAPEFGADYVVEQDFSHVFALQPDWQGLGRTVESFAAHGMPMEIINDMLHLSIPEYPGWDRGYVSAGVVPIDPETGEMVGTGAIGLPPVPGDASLVDPNAIDAPTKSDDGDDLTDDVVDALDLIRRVVREELEARA